MDMVADDFLPATTSNVNRVKLAPVHERHLRCPGDRLRQPLCLITFPLLESIRNGPATM